VNVQRYVPGRPANSSIACWEGEILAEIHVEVLRTSEPLGPSTVVRVIEHTEMAATAAMLVRRLGLSGFCGFDFILEAGTDAAHLIEINARCTPLCHLALGQGRDPVGALTARLAGHAAPMSQPMTDKPLIAHFPQAWQQDPTSELLRAAFHDVPWEDPGLVRELVRAPYAQRGLLARLFGRSDRRVRPDLPLADANFSTSPRSLDNKEGIAA
jgi:carbamoylphosphate synthase large subunit